MSQRATVRPPTLFSPEEYLEREMESAIRREFVDGAIYAMAGASDRHGIVVVNLASLLSNHLPDRCLVFAQDMKLRIKVENATLFYYPDVLVTCSDTDRVNAYFREQPVLIVEVLSPSTERVDRKEKFDAYTAIPSLQDYVLADQDIPKVEVFRRRAAWAREEFYPGDSLTLESAGLDLTVERIYRRVRF